jgi:hypothetical protein
MVGNNSEIILIVIRTFHEMYSTLFPYSYSKHTTLKTYKKVPIEGGVSKGTNLYLN